MKALTFSAILIGVCALLLWSVADTEKAVRRRREKGDEFDERQQLVRGEAYKRALGAVLIFLFIDRLVSSHHPWAADSYINLYLAMNVGFFVFSVYAIRHNAYFKLGTNPKKELAFTLAVGVFLALSSAFSLRRDPVLRNGMLTGSGLICVITLLYFALVAVIADHILLARRKGQDDEE